MSPEDKDPFMSLVWPLAMRRATTPRPLMTGAWPPQPFLPSVPHNVSSLSGSEVSAPGGHSGGRPGRVQTGAPMGSKAYRAPADTAPASQAQAGQTLVRVCLRSGSKGGRPTTTGILGRVTCGLLNSLVR